MNKALFLDRDGVINVEKNYVYKIEDFEFVDGIFELCALASSLGLRIFVITNQAGIGRGYYTPDDFTKLTDWMLEQFLRHEIEIAHVYHCPFHPSAGIGYYRRESFDRKPNPGMILKAREEFDLELSESVLIGDKDSDIEAGKSARIKYNIKLLHSLAPVSENNLEFSTLTAISNWLETVYSFHGQCRNK